MSECRYRRTLGASDSLRWRCEAHGTRFGRGEECSAQHDLCPPDHRCPNVSAYTPQGAFVAGAKWWEFQSRGATMWASDRDLAWAEAEKRYGPVAAEVGEK